TAAPARADGASAGRAPVHAPRSLGLRERHPPGVGAGPRSTAAAPARPARRHPPPAAAADGVDAIPGHEAVAARGVQSMVEAARRVSAAREAILARIRAVDRLAGSPIHGEYRRA